MKINIDKKYKKKIDYLNIFTLFIPIIYNIKNNGMKIQSINDVIFFLKMLNSLEVEKIKIRNYDNYNFLHISKIPIKILKLIKK